MVIAVDFDNTIVEEDLPKFIKSKGKYIGKIKDGAIEFLSFLKEEGHKIVIHSARMNPVDPLGCYNRTTTSLLETESHTQTSSLTTGR